jgi:hypothetical protein
MQVPWLAHASRSKTHWLRQRPSMVILLSLESAVQLACGILCVADGMVSGACAGTGLSERRNPVVLNLTSSFITLKPVATAAATGSQ